MNRTTGTQRYNNRMAKIFADARKLFAERCALELLRKLENLVEVVNKSEPDPFSVCLAIEQAKQVIEKAKGGK